jgi:hypothetical protein
MQQYIAVRQLIDLCNEYDIKHATDEGGIVLDFILNRLSPPIEEEIVFIAPDHNC